MERAARRDAGGCGCVGRKPIRLGLLRALAEVRIRDRTGARSRASAPWEFAPPRRMRMRDFGRIWRSVLGWNCTCIGSTRRRRRGRGARRSKRRRVVCGMRGFDSCSARARRMQWLRRIRWTIRRRRCLHRLLRGAWTEGLGGIHPVIGCPDGVIFAALFGTRHADIQAWPAEIGQPWR